MGDIYLGQDKAPGRTISRNHMGKSINPPAYVLSVEISHEERRLIARNLTHSYQSRVYPLREEDATPDFNASNFFNPRARRIRVVNNCFRPYDALIVAMWGYHLFRTRARHSSPENP